MELPMRYEVGTGAVVVTLTGEINESSRGKRRRKKTMIHMA